MESIFDEGDVRLIKLARLIGNAAFAAGDLPIAKTHLERFVRLKRQSGDDQGLDCVEAFHALGKIRHSTGDFDEARSAYAEAQKIYAVNNHAVQRVIVGKELMESVRNLDAACRGEPIDDGSPGPEENESNPVRSFIMKVGRSINMEQATARDCATGRANSMRFKHSDGKGPMLSNVRRAQSLRRTSNERKSSTDMPPGARRSGSLDRTSSRGLGSSMLFGRKLSMDRSIQRTSIDVSASFWSGGTERKPSIDNVSSSSSMDHSLSSSCQAVVSGHKLSSSAVASTPVMALDHLWASQIVFNEQDLPGITSSKEGEGRTSSDRAREENDASEDSPTRGSSSSPLQSNLNRNPSIMTAMRAAHTSVRNHYGAIREEAVQHQ